MSESGGATECALCGKKAPLRRSHIIPRFVSRALKTPDGPTRSLLCGKCEGGFGAYESTFARVVFHPLVAEGRVVAKYDKWLLQFAASVCWRILEEHLAHPPAGPSAQEVSCRETWRQFLVGRQSDVDAHPIHLLLADQNAGAKIGMKAMQNDGEGFVHAQLGPVTLLGMIADPEPRQWQGTRVHLQGKVKPREVFIPARYRDCLLTQTGAPAPA
jgi:hypothetical protein